MTKNEKSKFVRVATSTERAPLEVIPVEHGSRSDVPAKRRIVLVTGGVVLSLDGRSGETFHVKRVWCNGLDVDGPPFAALLALSRWS